MNTLLISLAEEVQVDEALVDRVLAVSHLLGVGHGIPLPITQLVVRTGIARLSVVLPDNHLRHFVDKDGLTAREKAEYRRGSHALSREELTKVHILRHGRLRLLQVPLVAVVARVLVFLPAAIDKRLGYVSQVFSPING